MNPGYIASIAPDECLRLLGDGFVGRVAWVSRTGELQLLPVNYTTTADGIVFTVAPGSRLAELSQPVDVLFQVDDLDAETATGWSVVVRGVSGPFTGDPDVVEGLPWAPGTRDVAVLLSIESLSGRAVSADS